jgi:hypothetical protein
MADIRELVKRVESVASSADSAHDTETVRGCLLIVETNIQATSRDLNDAMKSGASTAADMLVAMQGLCKFVVFIRVHYDDHEPVEASKFQQLLQALKDVEARAELGLENLGRFHAQVTSDRPRYKIIHNC